MGTAAGIHQRALTDTRHTGRLYRCEVVEEAQYILALRPHPVMRVVAVARGSWSVGLSPRNEIRRQSVSDRVSGHLDRTIFGVAPCALAGKPLL
jgi:hypothetical protein